MLLALTVGCPAGDSVTVKQPPVAAPVPPPPPTKLRAAVAEVDITPAPGLPMYGYSTAGAKRARGYWMRLKARIVVLEDGDGERIALVQTDLGASSALLHRSVAAKLAEQGIGPDRLLLSATHTHAGPGGFFGNRFYNEWVAARSGFDPTVLAWLAARIARGVTDAVGRLAPARVGVAEERVEGASHNRSREAYQQNYEAFCEKPPKDEVDRMVTVLRVDAVQGGASVPLGAFAVFAVHGTSIGPDNVLHHGDVHGAAARILRWQLEASYLDARGLVAAVANGAAGDVSPGPRPEQGRAVTMDTASRIARAALVAFQSLDGRLVEVDLSHGYREVAMRGAGTEHGRLCKDAVLGLPQIAGSEEGRGPLYGWFGMVEGTTREPDDCDATKVKAFGSLQDVVFDADDFPDVVPFQVIHFGKLLTLATVPGEPTTEVGRQIKKAVAEAGGRDITRVVGVANGYATYFTTGYEYQEQHYEGGATLYGPLQARFALEQLRALASSAGGPRAVSYAASEVFLPGAQKRFWPERQSCRAEQWKAGQTRIDATNVQFSFRGPSSAQACDLPHVAVRCGRETLRIDGVYPQDDEGVWMDVWRGGADHWTVRWRRQGSARRPCRIEVDRSPLPAVVSKPFRVGAR